MCRTIASLTYADLCSRVLTYALKNWSRMRPRIYSRYSRCCSCLCPHALYVHIKTLDALCVHMRTLDALYVHMRTLDALYVHVRTQRNASLTNILTYAGVC